MTTMCENLTTCASCGTLNIATETVPLTDLSSTIVRQLARYQECPNGCDFLAQHRGLDNCATCGAQNRVLQRVRTPDLAAKHMTYTVIAQECPNGH